MVVITVTECAFYSYLGHDSHRSVGTRHANSLRIIFCFGRMFEFLILHGLWLMRKNRMLDGTAEESGKHLSLRRQYCFKNTNMKPRGVKLKRQFGFFTPL